VRQRRHHRGLTKSDNELDLAMKAMMATAILTVGALGSLAATAAPKPAAFLYCGAQSISPRGAGFIVTSVFRSRSDPQFVENAFINYLRSSYAPYGNGWIFREKSPFCSRFDERAKAEYERSLNISRVPQPTQSIFNVTFVMQ
jgi:hypothetical protein